MESDGQVVHGAAADGNEVDFHDVLGWVKGLMGSGAAEAAGASVGNIKIIS